MEVWELVRSCAPNERGATEPLPFGSVFHWFELSARNPYPFFYYGKSNQCSPTTHRLGKILKPCEPGVRRPKRLQGGEIRGGLGQPDECRPAPKSLLVIGHPPGDLDLLLQGAGQGQIM